mgnify:CR=1 FL=1
MKHSIFRTLKLLILGNIFLIPFSIVVENVNVNKNLGHLLV